MTEIGIGTFWEDSSRLRDVTMTSLRPSPPPESAALAESAAEMVPDMRMQTAAVHQYDRVTAFASPLEMMEPDVVAIDETALS